MGTGEGTHSRVWVRRGLISIPLPGPCGESRSQVRRKVSSRPDSAKRQRAPQLLARGEGKFPNCFQLPSCPAPAAPWFPPFPGVGQDPMGSHACIWSAQSCLSFPNWPKPRDGYFPGDVGRGGEADKGDWQKRGIGGWGLPFSFRGPGRRASLPPPGI